jgi:hypothetical protein
VVSRKSHQRETTLSLIAEYCLDLGHRPVPLRPVPPHQVVIHEPILPNSGTTRPTGLPDGCIRRDPAEPGHRAPSAGGPPPDASTPLEPGHHSRCPPSRGTAAGYRSAGGTKVAKNAPGPAGVARSRWALPWTTPTARGESVPVIDFIAHPEGLSYPVAGSQS